MPDDDGAVLDEERIDPLRATLLGLCAALLAVAFFALLVVDQASAMTF